MVERIRELLDVRQLSPTQFADIIGIGRPVVSHILSGRNKASLEVVQKIIAAFPNLALSWLLTGEGPMLASTAAAEKQNPPEDAPNLSTTVRTRRKGNNTDSKESPAAQATAAVANNAPLVAPVPTKPEPPKSVLPTPAVPPAPTIAPTPVTSALPLDALLSSEKAIRRIVIFYRDGTFTDYQPER